MFKLKTLTAAAAIALLCSGAATAGDTDPLFINLTSDDGHRVNMALAFGGNQLERGHPLTVFLNDRGVMAASKANAVQFTDQQTTLQKLLDSGATILVCPMCMKHYGVAENDLLDGLKVGNPDLTGTHLFQGNVVTLTW
ncbi:DsrE family protein [Rhodobacteraceae bacterium KMM 6894]|nr:DsrE family protein [Rhodobacteraceae bacterium KMM 6894]